MLTPLAFALALAAGNPAPARPAPDQAVLAGTPSEDQVTTVHRIAGDRRGGRYVATAGTLVLRDDDGKPTQTIFYTAYRMRTPNGSQRRPLTFLWNGGPGWASFFLRMDAFGPLHVPLEKPADGADISLEPNDLSLLPDTDLVFLDAPGTGYSRPIAPKTVQDYASLDADADAFTRAIKRYLAISDSWDAPKYLLGESYGTARAVVVARMLQDQSIPIRGITLISPVLVGEDGLRPSDLDYVTWLPTQAATAWSHGLAGKGVRLDAFLREVEGFAAGPYADALFKGSDLPADQADGVARRLAGYTGLSLDLVRARNLRVDRGIFRRELLASQQQAIGAHDTRSVGPDIGSDDIRPHYDPSDTRVAPAGYQAMMADLERNLHYRSDLAYKASASIGSWDFSHRAPGYREKLVTADVLPDLAALMRQNGDLRVLVFAGYFDLATPYFRTAYDLRHTGAPAATLDRIRYVPLETGHMIYTDAEARGTIKAELSHLFGAAR